MRSELVLYGKPFEVSRARPARTNRRLASIPLLIERNFVTYHDYRIYAPADHEFRRDKRGCFLVHIHLSRLDGAIDERIVIPGCVAGSIPKALEMSARHAMRTIDERMGIMCRKGASPPVPSVASGRNQDLPVNTAAANSEEVPEASRSATNGLGSAVQLARQRFESAKSMEVRQCGATEREYVDALQALQASAMAALDATGAGHGSAR